MTTSSDNVERKAWVLTTASVTAMVVTLIGAVFLFGWFFGFDFATVQLFGHTPMKPDAALTFLLCGLSLFIHTRNQFGSRERTASLILSSAGLLVAVSCLVRLLMGDETSILSALQPGQDATLSMGPNTSVSLAVAALALLISCKNQSRAPRIGWLLMGVVLASGLLTLIGHMYDVPHLFKISNFTEMSAVSALTLVGLAVGYFATFSSNGPAALLASDTAGGFVVRSLLPSCMILPMVCGWFMIAGQREGLYPWEFGVACLIAAVTFIATICVFVIANSISKEDYSRRFAEALRANEEKYRAVTENALEGILTVDASGSIVAVNPGAMRIFRGEADSLMGKRLSDLLSDKEGRFLNKSLPAQLSANQDASRYLPIDAKGRCCDGFEFSAEVSLSTWKSGAEPFVTAVVRDVTSRKSAEARLNEFYAILAHELRSPLTSIRGSLELISLGTMKKEDTVELFEIAQSETDRMLRLINDLLDLKKIQVGDGNLQAEPINPSRLIRDGIDGLKGMALESKIEVKSEIDSDVPVLCDRDRIIQVITNILANGIKFSPPNTTITIKTEMKNSVMRFSVSDEGPGMSEVEVAALFRKFQQGQTSSTRYTGTGLGLAISKAIIERHRGTIGVDSVLGKGTTVWFELPCQTESEEIRAN